MQTKPSTAHTKRLYKIRVRPTLFRIRLLICSSFGMAATLPRVSVVIVTWNALPLLQQCLPSVVESDYENLEIVLADNDSDDGSAAWVEATYPSVKIVRHPENWAFCKGNNEAIPHTTGDYIILLNNDVEVTPGWLTPLVAHMETHADVGAIQPKLLQYDDRTCFEYAGGSGGFLDRLGYPFTRGRLVFTLESDTGQYDDARDIFWATGAALLLRRSAIEETGLLDERFFMHMEEIDLCWRLQRAGYRVRVEPESVVYHIGGASLPQGNPRKTYYNFRNNLLLLYKNLPPSVWRRVFPQRVLLDGLALLRALAMGNGREFVAILRGYWHAHQMKANYKYSRPSKEEAPILPSYQGSLIWDYFACGRKRFQDLPAHKFRAKP